jgi:transposase-like protein
MRGRTPSGPDYVDHLPGSDLARERARVVLETLGGQRRVQEACELLQISEPRFWQLREEMLTAAVASMEPGQAGRPAQTVTPEQAEIARLKQQLADIEVELKTAQARTEIAVILPNVLKPKPAEQTDADKKKPPRSSC